jgi:hypothetical protein
MVNSDGWGYVEYEVRNVVNNVITSDNLYLQEIAPTDNNFPTVLLSSTTQNQALLPGPIVPDGQGEILATWTISPSSGPVPQYPYQAVDVVAGVVGTPYNLPFSPKTVAFGKSPTIVLGESGVAFATNGTDTVNGPVVASFNVTTGAPIWSYQAGASSTLSIMAAIADGSLAVNDSQNGIVQIATTGSASQVTGALGSVPEYSWGGNWYVQGSQSASALALSLDVDPGGIWATPKGNPSKNGAEGALCPCLLQSSGTGSASQENPSASAKEVEHPADTTIENNIAEIQPAPQVPADCPICGLTSPSCLPVIAGSQSTYLLIVGDPGLNLGPGHNWNQGDSFALAAQQQANDLNSQGHRIIACRATTVQDFNNKLTTNGQIDGGVIYFGHAGKYPDPASGTLFSALFVGQDPITNENMYAYNVATLSNAELGPNAAIWLNGCDAGKDAPGGSSIAQLISNQLHRGVYAYDVGTYFSSSNAANDTSINGIGLKAPLDLPVYMVPEGTPGKKPDYIPFTPYQ